MDIVLQFVEGRTPFSNAIEWFSQGVVSHVDCVLPDGSLLGAQMTEINGIPSGVQIRPANYVAGLKLVRAVLPCDDPNMAALFYDLCRAEIGKPYDTSGLVANFIFGRDWRHGGSWWCSELQGAMLEKCGYFSSPLATPTQRLTPAGLLLACSARAPITLPN